MLANAKRLEILNTILDKKITVTEITKILGTRKANTSQHLMALRKFGLVKRKRVGKFIYYSIIDPGLVEPCRILKELYEEKRLGAIN